MSAFQVLDLKIKFQWQYKKKNQFIKKLSLEKRYKLQVRKNVFYQTKYGEHAVASGNIYLALVTSIILKLDDCLHQLPSKSVQRILVYEGLSMIVVDVIK